MTSAAAVPGRVAAPTASLADDVRKGLLTRPRQLPSHALYDALGSTLFDAICHLPWYPITRAEQQLLDVHHGDILAHAGWPRLIIELGPGNGDKLARLLRPSRDPADAGRPDAARTVHLVDISPVALAAAAHRLGDLGEPDVVSHAARYEDGLRDALAGRPVGARALVLFLGSNIGNFDPGPAQAFLAQVRGALEADDVVLVGADLVKPVEELVRAYDDPLGVTAAFNRNLLVRLNRELGANFDLDAFAHRAVWNAAASRMEMHLVSLRPQHVSVPGADVAFDLAEGETIWTESSYKYEPEPFAQQLRRAGLLPVRQWVDEESGFLLVLARAA